MWEQQCMVTFIYVPTQGEGTGVDNEEERAQLYN